MALLSPLPRMFRHLGKLTQSQSLKNILKPISNSLLSNVRATYAAATRRTYAKKKKPPIEEPMNLNLMKCVPKKEPSVAGANVAYVGGFGGIGFACCLELLCKRPKKLVILDTKEDCPRRKYITTTFPDVDFKFIRINLALEKEDIEEAIMKAYKHMGYIDFLINGAGIVNDRCPKLTVDINLLGLIETTLATIPLMSLDNGGKGGTIVHVSSVLGLVPCHCIATYTATKYAIIGFARSLSHDHYFDVTGVKHIILCPGPTNTPMLETYVGYDTFTYSKPISEKYIKADKQQPIDCAIGMVEAIEKGKNGSIWTIVMGEACPLIMTEYWEYTYDG